MKLFIGILAKKQHLYIISKFEVPPVFSHTIILSSIFRNVRLSQNNQVKRR
jgi:hypothetical protein